MRPGFPRGRGKLRPGRARSRSISEFRLKHVAGGAEDCRGYATAAQGLPHAKTLQGKAISSVTFRRPNHGQATKCRLRRQAGSQRNGVHLQVAGTVRPCSNAKSGGVCRAATDFDCVAVTLRCGHAVTFERFRRLIPLRAGLGDGFFAARKTPPAAGRQGRSATVSTLGNAE